MPDCTHHIVHIAAEEFCLGVALAPSPLDSYRGISPVPTTPRTVPTTPTVHLVSARLPIQKTGCKLHAK